MRAIKILIKNTHKNRQQWLLLESSRKDEADMRTYIHIHVHKYLECICLKYYSNQLCIKREERQLKNRQFSSKRFSEGDAQAHRPSQTPTTPQNIYVVVIIVQLNCIISTYLKEKKTHKRNNLVQFKCTFFSVNFRFRPSWFFCYPKLLRSVECNFD